MGYANEGKVWEIVGGFTKKETKWCVIANSSIWKYPMYSLYDYEPNSTNLGTIKKHATKTHTSDMYAKVKMLEGKFKDKTYYFYHFSNIENTKGKKVSGWIIKIDMDGDRRLEPPNTHVGTSSTNKSITNTNKQFDFGDWTETSGKNYEEWQHLLRSKMIIREDRNLWWKQYNRLQFANPWFAISGVREYVFFTKPDLHIMEPGATKLNPEFGNDAFWSEMKTKYRRIISCLQTSAARPGVPTENQEFIPLLTNAVAGSLDLPSCSAETTDSPSTIYGTQIQYRKGSLKSDEGYDFSLEFTDNPWLDVYHFFKMYDEYENLKDLGIVTPPGSQDCNRYRINRILHDQFSMYRFLVLEDDMSTIIHYAKFIGVFPKSVPRDAFSTSNIKDGNIQFSIDFHAQFVDDMKPYILYEFNQLAKDYYGKEPSKLTDFVPLWDDKYMEINGKFVDCPYIVQVPDSMRSTSSRYKLMWL